MAQVHTANNEIRPWFKSTSLTAQPESLTPKFTRSQYHATFIYYFLHNLSHAQDGGINEMVTAFKDTLTVFWTPRKYDA